MCVKILNKNMNMNDCFGTWVMRVRCSAFRKHFKNTIQSFKMKRKERERGLKETHSHCVIQLTPKTALEISSKEGREWGFDCKHAATS